MINNKRSYTEYNITTATTDFAIGFENYGVGSKDTIEVTLNGVPVESLGRTVRLKSAQVVEVRPAITSGVVRLQRATGIDNSFHKFTSGALFTAKSMDENFEQIRHSQQEVNDGFKYSTQNITKLFNTTVTNLNNQYATFTQDINTRLTATQQSVTTILFNAAQNTKAVLDAFGVRVTTVESAQAGLSKDLTGFADKAAEYARGAVNSAIEGVAINANLITDALIGTVGGVNQLSYNNGVANVTDLPANPKVYSDMRIYVKSVSSHFIFDTSSSAVVNGVTVVQGAAGKWIMETKDAYFASWFATPNVQVDQSIKLQVGYDYAVSKGVPFIIDANYYVKATTYHLNSTQPIALIIRSNSILRFSPKGKLTQITSNSSGSYLLFIEEVDNYRIECPHLIGDRRTNSGVAGGEWGIGIALHASTNGYIDRPRLYDFWGDGIYIGKNWGSTKDTVPTNITIYEPYINGARRNGISLCAWKDVSIIRPNITRIGTIDGIAGTAPRACIDIELESNPASYPARGLNAIIESPNFSASDNGLYVYAFHDNMRVEVHVKGITTFDSISGACLGLYHGGANCTGQVVIDELYYRTAPYNAVSLGWNKLSSLTATINKVTLPKDADFLVTTGLLGAYKDKELGNVTVNNINCSGFCAFLPPSDTEYKINGYRFHMAAESKSSIVVYAESAAAFVEGKDTYIDNSTQINPRTSNIRSGYVGNVIWLDPSEKPITEKVYVTVSDDKRVLKVGLANSAVNVGMGCNIYGVKIKTPTGVKEEISTITRGGWLKFQNDAEGNTTILDSYGDWTFS